MNHAANTSRSRLRQTIGGLGFFSLALGSMIGVGWITALDDWLDSAGPLGATLAFTIGGSLMMLIGLCYAELTPMLPVTGGEVAYAYKAHGTSLAFLVGWCLAIGYIAVSAFEAVSVGIVLAYLLPSLDTWPLYEIHGSTVFVPHLLIGIGLTGVISWVNHRGSSLAIGIQVGLTFLLLGIVLLFVVVGIMSGSGDNLVPLWGSRQGEATTSVGAGILAVLVTVPFWFVGFDTIPQAAEERSDARLVKRLGMYIIASIVTAVVFYGLVILSASMVAPWQETVQHELPTAAAFESALASPFWGRLVLLAGLVGLLTSWNGFFLAGTRVLFALGRGRIIDHRYGQVHPMHGTPTRAIILVGGITAAAACLGRGALVAFVEVGAFCISLAFLGVAWSLIRLRTTAANVPRPYRLPAGRLVATLAAAGSLGIVVVQLVPGSPAALDWPLDWCILLAVILCGLVLWLRGRQYRNSTSDQDRSRLILGDS